MATINEKLRQAQEEAMYCVTSYLKEHPEEMESASEELDVSMTSLRRWLREDAEVATGGENYLKQLRYLRRHELIDEQAIDQNSQIWEYIRHLIVEKGYEVDQLAKHLEVKRPRIIEWIRNQINPIGLTKIRVSWFLHSDVKSTDGSPIREIPGLTELAPAIQDIYAKIGSGRITLENLAEEIRVKPLTILHWLQGAESPTEEQYRILEFMLEKHFQANSVESKVESPTLITTVEQASDKTELVSTERIPSPEEMIVAMVTNLRNYAIGHLLTLSPSKAAEILETMRQKAPELFNDIYVIASVLNNPEEEYGVFRKGMRNR